jgi:hypothetical protein
MTGILYIISFRYLNIYVRTMYVIHNVCLLTGENKNRFVVAYLCWRVLTTRHRRINLMMQVPGHTKCLVDAGFGQAKKLYRRSNCESLEQVADVFNKSSISNEAVMYDSEDRWVWRDWKSYFMFTPLVGIRKCSHFEVDSTKPGIVSVKESLEGPSRDIQMLQNPSTVFDGERPPVMPAAGLTAERQRYLHRMVRPHVSPAYKDVICPAPSTEE